MYEAFGTTRRPATEVIELVEHTADIVNQLANEQALLQLDEAEAQVANVIYDYLRGHVEQIDDILELDVLPRNKETVEVQQVWHAADRKHLIKEMGKTVARSMAGESFREALHGRMVSTRPHEGVEPSAVFRLVSDSDDSSVPTEIVGTVIGTSLIDARLSIQASDTGKVYLVHILGDEDPRQDAPKAQVSLEYLDEPSNG